MNTQFKFKNWKIKFTLFMAIIVVVIAFVSSCTKEKEKDYRDKWVESYYCEKVHNYVFGIDSASYVNDTIITQLIIDVTIVRDSLLHITERDLPTPPYPTSIVSHDVKVKNDGSFIGGNGNHPYITGNFYRDSLFLHYRFTSPGRRTTVQYTGIKLKSVKQ